MDQQKEKEQNPMKGKHEEDINLIANKIALLELEDNQFHRRLPLELECEIFKCLKEEIQTKFIWGMGRGIYAIFQLKLLTKTKRLRNPSKNYWRTFNKSITVSPDGSTVTNNINERAYVFSSKGFAISAEHSRADNFPGTILYYFEVKHFGDIRIGLADGVISDPTNPSSFYFRPNICVVSLSNDCYCICYIAAKDYLLLPEGAKKYDRRNVYGCGLVLDSKDKLTIFFTSNGRLIDQKMPISSSVDYLFPAVTLFTHASSIEANFGAKPFEYDIQNCPGLGWNGFALKG